MWSLQWKCSILDTKLDLNLQKTPLFAVSCHVMFWLFLSSLFLELVHSDKILSFLKLIYPFSHLTEEITWAIEFHKARFKLLYHHIHILISLSERCKQYYKLTLLFQLKDTWWKNIENVWALFTDICTKKKS